MSVAHTPDQRFIDITLALRAREELGTRTKTMGYACGCVCTASANISLSITPGDGGGVGVCAQASDECVCACVYARECAVTERTYYILCVTDCAQRCFQHLSSVGVEWWWFCAAAVPFDRQRRDIEIDV